MAKLGSQRLGRLSALLGLSLVLALWIACAQIRLFPSTLNKCAIAHPWLLHNGFVEYRDIPGQKSPLLPLFLSWLLPVSPDAALNARIVHGVIIGFVVLTSLLWVARRSGPWAMLGTGVFLLAWSNFFGLWAILYYDVALAPLYLLAFVLSVAQMERPAPWKMAALGLVTGLAILTKQHALLLVLPAAGLLAWQLLKRPAAAPQVLGLGLLYLAGLALPLGIYAWSYYRQAGSFQDLVFWTLTINLTGSFGSEATLAPQAEHVRDMLPALLMLLPFAGSLAFPWAGMKPGRGVRLLLLVMLCLAAVLVYPRYSTRHWAAAFPFLAMLSGITLADLVRGWRQLKTPSLLWVGASILLCWLAIALIVYLPWLKDPRPLRSSEYSDLVELAGQLRQRLPAEGEVVLLPLDEGNANLSYLLGRLPAHYWLFNYRWFMNPTTIERWLEVMEEEQPGTLLFFPEGIDLTESAPEILDYVDEHYELVDTVPWGSQRQVQVMVRSEGAAP